MSSNNFFEGRTVVLATMHGKEKVIAPILEKELGVKVIIPQNFDSDQFGTFTRDKARTGSQLEAARFKALAAMKLTGADIGVASEGSFGTDPSIPFIQSNLELVILIDTKNNLEIRGYHRTPDTNMSGRYVTSVEEAIRFADEVGFPDHAVVVRKSEKRNSYIQKGIQSRDELVREVKKLLSGIFTRRVYIETDMRAHMNPTRMDKIEHATNNLISNINSLCPECGAPGFVMSEVKSYMRCGQCDRPTKSPLSHMWRCQKCNTEKTITRNDKEYEDPGMCTWCNP
jgi:hypothetical protein